jgi:hypothetical protein
VKAIPKSVLNLLAVTWRETGNYSAFDSIFNDETDYDRKRQSHPSFYIHRHDDDSDNNGLKTSEVRALVADGVLIDHGKDDASAVNEHEHHALTDFCSEVYDAWKKYRSRVERARRVYRGSRDAM